MRIKKVEQFLIIVIMFGQLCCAGWFFPGVKIFPAYLLCLVAQGVLSLSALLLETKGMLKFKESFGLMAVFLILNIALVYLFNDNFDIQRLALIVCSFTFCLGCTRAFQTKEEIEKLLKWYLLIVTISALVEIGQVLEMSFCVELWEKLHTGNKIIQAIENRRYLGLASDSLQFAYHVTAALAIAFFVNFKRFSLCKRFALIALYGVALLTNATRSGLIAMLVIVIIRIFTFNEKNNKIVRAARTGTAFLATLILFLLIFGSSFLDQTRFSVIEGGAEARLPMLLTAFNHASRYPFGMGVYSVQPDLVIGANMETYPIVVSNTAHNLLGNCVASYGFIGLGLLLGMYVWAFKTYKRKIKIAQDPEIYTIALCGLITLAINAFFHNAYILNGELSSFVFFAIMCTACNVKKADDVTEREY